jgi:hypothetical protein
VPSSLARASRVFLQHVLRERDELALRVSFSLVAALGSTHPAAMLLPLRAAT